jgi:hypothetical protein
MKRIKALYAKIRSYFPSKLAVGMTEYEEWLESTVNLAGNFADKKSLDWALSTMILHAPSDKDSISKQYFVKRLRKGAANQVASQKIQDIKAAQDAQQAEQKQAEDTAKQVVSDGQSS